MSNRHQSTARKSSDNFFRLKPLVAGVRVVMTGGLLVGSVAPVHAELPIPVPGQGWVSSGSATSQIIGNTLRIDQQTDRAILNWQSFNVDRENTVQFVQPGSSSIALNRIEQQDPSRILGQIIANGQVYLYNKNGFVFGQDSVVNANSFMASTLNITDEAFTRGITRIFDENGGAALAIEPMKPGDTLDPKTAKILIEAGAKIHTDKAGRIIIAAPTIENRGSLSTEEQGQVILAASQDKVYLQAASKDSPFAGLVVEVDTGGKVSNMGDILARQGNVTLAGFAVNQQGRVSATSSVNVNGSIRLLAQEQHDASSQLLRATKTTRAIDNNDGLGTEAKLTFHSGSVTQIVADNDGATAIDEQKQPQSYLEAKAHTIELKSNAAIVVPGGKVDITATDNLADPLLGTKGRIYVDNGALIDVSGTKGIDVAMERNVGEISVQSYELRDAPLQKTGVLKGETIRVDLRRGSKIVDTSGAEARIVRGIDERLGTGGEINLTSSGDVIIIGGARIDISGGSVDYRDGYISTTKLLTDYGRIVDISDADPNEHYAAVYGVVKEVHQKWGVERVWNILEQFGQGRFERGYREGKAAGSINIKAPYLAWNGELSAGSDTGRYQRLPGDRPDGGRFVFDSTAFVSAFQDVRFQTEKNNVVIGLEDQFPKTVNNKPQPLVLSTGLTNSSGVQHLVVKTNGQVSVAAGTDVRMAPGAEFSVQAVGTGTSMTPSGEGAAIDVRGQIHVAGGTINLTVADLPSDINLGATSVLDVSGRWVNDLQQGLTEMPVDPLYLDGGSVKLRSIGDLYLQAGSSIKADGGAGLAQNGKITAGKGGKIELAAVGVGEASLVHMDGQVSAVSLSKGGSLTLNSGEIIIGSGPSKTTDPLRLAVVNGRFAFDPESGFGAINLISNFGGITVSSDTNLDLQTKNLVLSGQFREKTSDSNIRDFSNAELLPEHLRQPFQLSLTANTDVSIDAGSVIRTDKESTISLLSRTGSIFVDGLLQAEAGQINLAIKPLFAQEYDAKQAIWVGEHARLLAQGTSRLNPIDVLGHLGGKVLNGGEINFEAERGAVVLVEGSQLDVSGTHTQLDILQPASNSNIGGGYVSQTIASNAGKIKITAAEGIVLDGTLRAAGSSGTQGGVLGLTLNRAKRNLPNIPSIPYPTNPLVINVTQAARRSLDANVNYGNDFPGALNGQVLLSADLVSASGFAELSLNTPDRVEFVGNVNLVAAERIGIDTPVISAISENATDAGRVNLNTVFLQMGSSLNRDLANSATTGKGRFSGHAQWIQLNGATRWDGFSQISLNSDHDLRGIGLRNGDEQRDFVGGLVTAADLDLHASQIYPSTLSNFTFAVKNNPNGKINITGNNTDVSPLSAGGTLTFEAPVINQQGVLKAPLGTINLKAGSSLTLGENSVTSASAAGQVIPFGVTQGGLDWLYPLDSLRNLFGTELENRLEKRLVMSAPQIDIKKGSVVDISGGGDLQSYEFQPGAGGSFDYLQPGSGSYQGGFAILPSLGSQLAPHDHFESQSFPYAPGATVYLNGSKGLPAGEYAILPAHYALLPGAFLITPQANSQDQVVTRFTPDGLSIVPGYLMQAGTGVADARSSGFKIENGADVRLHSKYDTHMANEFFVQRALKNETATPVLPIDGGQISLVAQTKLIMEGQFMTDALASGRGSKMDIAADRIVVTGQLSQAPVPGTLEILADNLSALKVDSLLLGGARSRNKTNSRETDVEVTAQEVVFAGNAHLQGAEFIAAATGLIEVQGGASLEANRKASGGDSVLNVKGDGALLRVSGDKQVVFNRTETAGVKGELRIAGGSVLKASESMLLDASQSTQLLGDIEMQGGSLNLAANTINIGEVDNLGGNALNLSNRKLVNLSVDELVLTGRDSIGVYGNVGRVDANGVLLLDENGLSQAIRFERLAINAAGLVGHGSAANKARLEAGKLQWQNTAGAINHQVIDGQGQLDLLADNIEIGSGHFSIQGFDNVNISAANKFRATGVGSLDVAADLTVATAVLTADGGSALTMNASGYQAQLNSLNNTASVGGGFGGAIEVIADAIAFNAKAVLPSGSFGLHALNGDVNLGGQAIVDLAGRAVAFADQTAYTPGGHFKAVADHGKVITAADSLIDIKSGGGEAAGGSLTLQAPDQSVILLGQIKAAAGSATFDVGGFDAESNFDSLMSALAMAGVEQSIYFRSRNADIVQSGGSNIKARNVTLVADRGVMTLAAGIHADAAERGGSIKLYAGDSITLAKGAELTALGTGNGAKGGQVLLSSVDADNDGLSGIDIQNGSSIAVSGNGGEGGEVTLRALRTGNGINIQPVSGNVSGYSKFYAEGVKKYGNADLGNDGQINTADINKIKTQTAAYMTAGNMQNVANLRAGMHLTAGVEINYSGNLTLKDTWDLAGWRYDDVADANVWDDLPGRLVIKASGDFKVEKSLTDGFKTGNFTYPGATSGSTTTINIVDKLQGGDSWSYNVAAGADGSSADINATAQSGNLVIGSNAVVRTGSGDMQFAAGGDITFTDGTSSIYNAGRPTEVSPFGSLKDRFVGQLFYSEYPVAGGDLTLAAGGNIKGAVVTNNDFNDWLLRIGNWSDASAHAGERPTAWGVALGYITSTSLNPAKGTKPFFQQNIGSFGGGSVMISAGGNISDLDVMMPTTGKQVGTADNSTANSFDFLSNQVEVNGGGLMDVKAGGNIAGGSYYLGKGTGTLTAAGQITGGTRFKKGPEVLIGDTRFSVNAGSSVSLTGVSDPMIAHKADVNFFSYSPNSAINVSSLSGDVLLGANGTIFPRSNTNSNQQALARIYPASLNAKAFGGSIELANEIILFPSAEAELNLFAQQDITANVGIRLGMSDGDRSLLPGPEETLARNSMAAVIGRIDPFGSLPEQLHAAVPVHTGDNQPVRLVTLQGDIENIGFNLPKKALIKAGRDMVNLSLSIQHVNNDDVSMLEAVRDVRYTSDRDPKTGALLNNSAKIEIGGPGEVLVKAGRNVDLGASGGISTVGNVYNTGLAEHGANLTILTGANGELNYAGFIDTYLQGRKQYSEAFQRVKLLITDFMRQRLNNDSLDETTAIEAFAKLNSGDFVAIQPQLNAIILPVFFNEIKESGVASASNGSLGNQRGFAVIDALFPGSDWKGDLSMFFSKIQTVDNGNINLLVPGGQINAGLATSFVGAKLASELGIVAQRQGDINVMVHDDFMVNTSRVFSLDGGNIMVWSSEGSIDAGRGAKSAIAAPPPVVSFDEKGNLKIEFPPIVSGSGIRTAASSVGVAPGDVYLFAPKGVVDAGEAGIGCNNCFIVAPTILGANNIQASGVSIGVPVASTGSVAAGLTGTSNMTAGVSQVAESSVSASTNNDKSAVMKNAVLGMLSVEVLGFGD